MFMIHILGTATVTAIILHTGAAGTEAGITAGTTITDGIHQDGTGDGTGTTTGDGILGTQIHIGDGTILFMTLGGALHTGLATIGLYTDLEYIRVINLDITLVQAQVQNQPTAGRFTTERETVHRHIKMPTGTMAQTAMLQEDQVQEA